MRSVSTRFLDAVRGGGELAVRASLDPITGPSVDLFVVSGDVTLDRTADQRGSGSLTVPAVDPATGLPISTSLSPFGAAPYGAELSLYRGFNYADNTSELVRLGVFRVDSAPRSIGENQVQLSLVDRSAQLNDEKLVAPVTFTGATLVEDAIESLITDVYPSAVVNLPGDSTTLGKRTVIDQDRWQAIKDFAASIGCEVYVDQDGEWVVQDVPDPTAGVSVWTINAGSDGVLVDGTITPTRQGVYNGVVVTGEPAEKHAPAYALVTDDDPASPTMWGGPFGRVPDFYTSETIRTDVQAQAAGEARLRDLLGVARAVDLSAVPNPALEPGDTVTVVYPDATTELHLIDSVQTTLAPDGAQSITTRATPL